MNQPQNHRNKVQAEQERQTLFDVSASSAVKDCDTTPTIIGKKGLRLMMGLLAGTCIVLGLKSLLGGLTVENLRSFLSGYGVYAPLAYVITISIASNLFVPMSVLIITGGLLFGAREGFLYAFLGATLSVSFGYALYKNLGIRYTRSLPGAVSRLVSMIEHRGFMAMTAIRLLTIPFAAQNFIGATLDIPFRSYFIGSIIGMTPWLLGFSFFGSSLTNMNYHLIILSAGALLVLFGIAFRLTKTGEGSPPAAGAEQRLRTKVRKQEAG